MMNRSRVLEGNRDGFEPIVFRQPEIGRSFVLAHVVIHLSNNRKRGPAKG